MVQHPGSTGGGGGLLATTSRPKLPRLEPHVNKRAQRLVTSHLRSLSSADSLSSTATIPVLTQIDSTAPRTARTHDISHLRDQAAYLTPSIPASLIEEQAHIFETSFMPKDTSSWYEERDGLWHTKVFPSDTPSSRMDAVLLDAWITRSLEQYSRMGAGKEDLVRAVEDLVPILSVALHEIVRQVTHHCLERGVVLEKIWRTYVELFDRVLHQMQESLRTQRQKTTDVQKVLAAAREDLGRVRRSHPEQMQRVISDLEATFTQRQLDVEQELRQHEEENSRLKMDLRRHHGELELWYPSFQLYQDSYVKSHIPQYVGKVAPQRRPMNHNLKRKTTMIQSMEDAVAQAAQQDASAERFHSQDAPKEPPVEEEIPPEVAIAEDFKRLLAVLGPDKRKIIGKELSEVLGPSVATAASRASTAASPKSARMSVSKVERKKSLKVGISEEEELVVEGLRVEVSEQEDRIRELRDRISQLERDRDELGDAKHHVRRASARGGKAPPVELGQGGLRAADLAPTPEPDILGQGGLRAADLAPEIPEEPGAAGIDEPPAEVGLPATDRRQPAAGSGLSDSGSPAGSP